MMGEPVKECATPSGASNAVSTTIKKTKDRTGFITLNKGNKFFFMTIILPFLGNKCGTTPLTGEHAQATLRGRPRGRLGTVGSGNGCVRGRPRGRFGTVGSETAFFRGRLAG